MSGFAAVQHRYSADSNDNPRRRDSGCSLEFRIACSKNGIRNKYLPEQNRWSAAPGCILNCVENKADAKSIANRVACRLSAPYNLKGQNLRVHSSIGISFFPENGNSYETLIQRADQAMYSAKKKGKGQFCFA